MSFEKIYIDGSPIEEKVCIEKMVCIERGNVPIIDPMPKVIETHIVEKPIEKNKSKSPKKKAKKLHSKPNKAAVASIQKKL
jgi:hypothetical protein